MTAIDPVCEMTIERDSADSQEEYADRTYYFCSEVCRREFMRDPERYAAKNLADMPTSTRNEPPFTKKDGMVSPKFGSAGSGGAEYEPGPDKRQ